MIAVSRLRRAAASPALAGTLLSTVLACAAGAPVREDRPVPPPGSSATGASPERTAEVDEVLRRAEAIRNPDAGRAMEVEIVSVLPDARAGARKALYSLASNGASLIALRQSEDDMRGGVLLFSEERAYLLRPGAGTRQAYELAGAQSRLGDWVALRVAGLDLRHGWAKRLSGIERYGDEPCFKLELTRDSAQLPWTRLVYWIGKADLRPKRLEGYDAGGFLVSMVRYESFSEAKDGVFPRRVVFEGGTPLDEIHTATFTDARAAASDPSSFTSGGMVALKDAARLRGVMRKNQPLVRVEELLPPARQ